jgi:hypothetical protein
MEFGLELGKGARTFLSVSRVGKPVPLFCNMNYGRVSMNHPREQINPRDPGRRFSNAGRGVSQAWRAASTGLVGQGTRTQGPPFLACRAYFHPIC